MKEHRTSNIEHPTSNQAAVRKVFDLEERLLNFAVAIIDTCENLPKTRSGNHVAGQLLRSGTSPYSNHGEAESAESPDDFIHKLKICLKELRETRRWLRLVDRKQWLPNCKEMQFALSEVEEQIRIFVTSIRTAERNRLQRLSTQQPLKPPPTH